MGKTRDVDVDSNLVVHRAIDIIKSANANAAASPHRRTPVRLPDRIIALFSGHAQEFDSQCVLAPTF
jgi:hypothetical protein